MVTIGNKKLIFFGTQEKPKSQVWWQENGFIMMEYQETHETQVLSIEEFGRRLKLIAEVADQCKVTANKGVMHSEENQRIRKFIRQGNELIADANAAKKKIDSMGI